MKKVLMLMTCATFAVALAAAQGCSGGDDDDDDDGGSGPLDSGTYAIVGAPVVNDGCAEFYGNPPTSYYDGVDEVDVVASATSIQISGFLDDLEYEIDGTDLIDVEPTTQVIDFNDPETLTSGNTYDCVVDYTVSYLGEITGDNEFSLTDTYMVSGSGSQCAVAVSTGFGIVSTTTLPCTTTDTVDLAF